MIYKFTNDDIDKINELIKVTSSIDSIYNKLYDLEIKGKQESNEYKKLLEYLSIMKEVEDKLYDEANLTFERCVAWTNYITMQLPQNFTEEYQSLINQDYDNRIFRRILAELKRNVVYNYKNIKKLMPKEMLEFGKKISKENSENFLNNMIHVNAEIKKAIDKDILNAYLLFVQEFIDNPKYDGIKTLLIKSKYNTYFINKESENEIINNKFVIPSELYINSKFIADINQFDLKMLKILKDDNAIRIAIPEISQLIEMTDIEYNNQKKAITSILRQCLLRSSFLLMSDLAIEEVNFAFHKLIDDKKYFERHKNDRISEQHIINCFKNINKDKTKQNIVSFGYRKK